jgi:hypothetical protein
MRKKEGEKIILFKVAKAGNETRNRLLYHIIEAGERNWVVVAFVGFPSYVGAGIFEISGERFGRCGPMPRAPIAHEDRMQDFSDLSHRLGKTEESKGIDGEHEVPIVAHALLYYPRQVSLEAL